MFRACTVSGEERGDVTETSAAESGTRARTRRAIVDAAVALLARNPGASMSDVAVEAGVGRTTVHRYFAERSELITALTEEADQRIEEATERARLSEGPADEVLVRLCQEYFELGDWLTLMFTQSIQPDSEEFWTEEGGPAEAALVELIMRGHREGSIDDAMRPDWLSGLLWSLLFTAWAQVRAGTMNRHSATTHCLDTLRKIIQPR
jgi:AcrR family transcriptional regulator